MYKKARVLKYNYRRRENELIVVDVDVRLYSDSSDFRALERRLAYLNPGCDFTVLGWLGEEWKYRLDAPIPDELFGVPQKTVRV